jgi:hypothetical protein
MQPTFPVVMAEVVCRLLSGRSGALGCALALAAAWGAPAGASAQTGELTVRVGPAAAAPAKVAAMISILNGGEVVRQQEILLENGGGIWCCIRSLPVGVYDIRLEAEGLVTEAKRGIRVLDKQAADITFLVHPGKGVHIVEYATGGLAREEVATRLNRLESFAKGTVKWFGSDSTHGPVPQF